MFDSHTLNEIRSAGARTAAEALGSRSAASHARAPWWTGLGLGTESGSNLTGSERVKLARVENFLRSCEPAQFTRVADDGSVEQLTYAEVAAHVAAIKGAHDNEKSRAAAERLALGWRKIEAAYAADTAEQLVTEGRWRGFSYAEATAWCWNLFQFEPHGFVHPGSQVRGEALQRLKRGELPEVFSYPERARELADAGLDPRSYRTHQEALGKPTYDPSDVRRS